MSSAAGTEKTSAAPNAADTPRPPEKPRNGDRLWPMIAARPASTSTSMPAPTQRARRTAAVPFSMSSRPERSARRGPSARITFAPPVRPLPIVRGSGPPERRATMTPHGMPPMKYAATVRMIARKAVTTSMRREYRAVRRPRRRSPRVPQGLRRAREGSLAASRTAAASGATRAARASERSSSIVHAASAARTSSSEPASADSSSTPRPTRTRAPAGSPASSPHTATGMPAASAPATTPAIARRTAGWSASWKRARIALPRSAAIRYWVRSFVPMLKKATRRASSGARSAAAGISTMIPVTIVSAHGWPAATTAARASSRSASSRSTSSSVATIGAMTWGTTLGQPAGAPDRPQLGPQELAVAIGEPDRPDAEEGVGLGGKPQVRDRPCRPRCRPGGRPPGARARTLRRRDGRRRPAPPRPAAPAAA